MPPSTRHLPMIVPFLLLLVSAGLLGCSNSKAQEKSFLKEHFLQAEREYYDLFAPNEEELNKGREELDYAVKQMKRHLGPPPRIAVVLVDDPRHLDSVDLSGFREEGQMVLPMLSRKFLNSIQERTTVIRDWGTVLFMQDSSKFLVKRIIPLMKLQELDLKEGDLITSLNDSSFRTVKKFQEHYRGIEAGKKVEVGFLRDGKEQRTSFTKKEAEFGGQAKTESSKKDKTDSTKEEKQGQKEQKPLPRVLSHEAGHIFFVSYVCERSGESVQEAVPDTGRKKKHSGHPDIADWLDESVAMLCEYDSLQIKRLRGIKERLEAEKELLSLEELFRMENPNVKSQKASSNQANREQKGGVKVSFSVSEGKSKEAQKARERSMLFYRQSLSVMKFLIDREGKEVVGKLVEADRKGEPLESVLEEAKGLPSDIEELEKEWRQWVLKGEW